MSRSHYSAALLGFGSALSLAVSVASADSGYFPGFDDWFWGGTTGSVGSITNSTAITGATSANQYVGDVDPAVIQDWIDHPENNFGLAFIALPPGWYGNAMFNTHLRTWQPDTWPIITINGDTTLKIQENAAALIMRENPTYNYGTNNPSNTRMSPVNGPHPVLWSFDTSAIAPGTVVSSAHLTVTASWTEANRNFDVYKLHKAWDPATVTYQNYVGDRWTWKNGNGNFDDVSHWDGIAFPNGDTEISVFPSAASRVTVTADIAVSSGGVRFQSPAGYTINGAGSLSTNAGTWMAQATAGDNIIDLPYYYYGSISADIAAGAKISLNKGVTNLPFSRRSITKYGGGTLAIDTSRPVFRNAAFFGTTNTFGAAASVVSGGVTSWVYTEGGTLAFTGGGVIDIAGTVNPTADQTVAGKYHGQMDIGKSSVIIRPNTWDANDNAANHAAKVVYLNNLVKAGLENVQADGSKNYDWLGGGIGSKAAVDRNSIDGAYGVGLMDNNDGAGGAIYTMFANVGTDTTNVPVDATCILLKLTYNGDTDLNGIVNTDDYFGMLAGMANSGTGWTYGDFDYNGVVNGDDYFMFLTGLAAYKNEGGLAPQGVAVPEPATLGLLALGGLLLGRRRSA